MKHLRLSFAALALVVAGSGPVRAAEAAIALLPQARVAAGAVTLGQVATIHTTDLALIRALVHLPIGRAPAAGDSVVVQREAVAAWMQQRLRTPATVAWDGPEQTRVLADSRTVSGEELAAAAEAALREWLAGRSERSEVQVAWLPREVDAPEGAELRARPLGATAPRSRMVVWVDVRSAGRFVRTVPVSFTVEAWRTVATAGQALPAGAPLHAADVVERSVDVATLDGTPLAGPSADASVRLRHALPAGVPVRAADLAAAPAVLRGQWASLRSGEGAVVSESRVEVLQDGRPGEKVRVRQPGAMAQVMGRVVAPGQLEIVR